MHESSNPFLDAMSEAIQELIRDTEASLEQLKRTERGLRRKIRLETHHLDLLREKYRKVEEHRDDPEESGMSIADYIAKVLQESVRPLRVSEIVAVLEENDVPTSSENGHMSSVLSALRRRSDLFERVSRGMYKLRDAKETKRKRRSSRSRAVASV